MYPHISDPYDTISTNILGLLINFSNTILVIENSTNEILTSEEFNKNIDFLQFVGHFGEGRYYHFRCQGYMESLVVTKCYSPLSICYWLNSLVYPAVHHFTIALEYLDKVKADSTFANIDVFQRLLTEIDNCKQVSMKIQQTISLYNLQC